MCYLVYITVMILPDVHVIILKQTSLNVFKLIFYFYGGGGASNHKDGIRLTNTNLTL